MANVNSVATSWNCPNYTGELYLIGANQTPFLNMIGGLQGGAIRTLADFQFALAQPWALEAAAQPEITETASLTAPNPWTYVRDQDVNTVQIYHRAVTVSYKKQSVVGQVTADATTKLQDVTQMQPVQNERDFQISAHMRQIAVNADYTFLNGTYQQSINAGVAAKTRGIITAATTNTVAAGGADLDKALIDQLLREMATNGSEFVNPVIFVNAFSEIVHDAKIELGVGNTVLGSFCVPFGGLFVIRGNSVSVCVHCSEAVLSGSPEDREHS